MRICMSSAKNGAQVPTRDVLAYASRLVDNATLGGILKQLPISKAVIRTSSTVFMPIRCTATPFAATESLMASVPMSTPCACAARRASAAASSTGLGAGCQSAAPCTAWRHRSHTKLPADKSKQLCASQNEGVASIVRVCPTHVA